MAVEKLILEGPAGDIEARLELNVEQPMFRALICHPHPLFGGTMDNKVVTTLSRACRDAGAAVLRFNFRGVGASQGVHGGGFSEAEDLLAAEAWLDQRYPDLPLWLAGFSFGSYVAARGAVSLAANGRAPVHLMLLAPPVHNNDFTALDSPGCRVSVVQGEDDEVVPPEEVYRWAERSAWTPELIRIPSAGHFFHGRLPELASIANDHFPGQG